MTAIFEVIAIMLMTNPVAKFSETLVPEYQVCQTQNRLQDKSEMQFRQQLVMSHSLVFPPL